MTQGVALGYNIPRRWPLTLDKCRNNTFVFINMPIPAAALFTTLSPAKTKTKLLIHFDMAGKVVHQLGHLNGASHIF